MNRLRDRVGLNFAPLLLRLMLAVIFIFAGLVKMSASIPVEGEDAAILANLGVITPAQATNVAPPPAPTSPAPTGPAAPTAPTEEPPKPSGMGPGSSGAAIVLVRQAGPKGYTAADFPKPVNVLSVYGLAAMLYKAAHPATPATGGAAMPLWPAAIGERPWPVYLAWAVAITELVGGAALLLGLFTRVMALAVAGVMIGAIWLTQIGPAIQAQQTRLWIIPDRPIMDPQWQGLFLQVALLMSALALAFLGPGRASLDRAILGGPDGKKPDDEDDDE
jgi:uncharacterized membrane protein YphA (DoxX/SURF4 family)